MRFSTSLAAGIGVLLLAGAAAAQGSDDCSTAQAISGTGFFSFDNTSASTDGGSNSGCTTPQRDVWFSWTAPMSDTYTVTTCGGAGFDTVLTVYDGGCGSSVEGCNDDACGLQSSVSFSATSGNQYTIRLGSFSSTTGSGTLEIIQGGPTGGCNDQSSGPDVIVGDLSDVGNYGGTGGVGGYSLGTTSCNIGDAELNWIAGNNQHPVIAQNVYRLENGRFEQIGMSWLKHGFTALQGTLCCDCIPSGTGSRLGVGCSDPYVASLNGSQSGLGPRFEVDPHTGSFSYPFFAQGSTGNQTYKRIQIANSDLDPAQHPTAQYFGEGQYIAPDDAASGNGNNNASYRPMTVGSFSGGSWNLGLSSFTRRQLPAIQAWQDSIPSVQLEDVQVPGEGLFIVGSHCTDNGDGTWHYEYAVYNMNSDVAGGSFTVPVPAGVNVTNIGFHDVDHHSGEPYDGTDWAGNRTATTVRWTTDSFGANANANAIRWGTLYNFRFDADTAPTTASGTLGLFKPYSPGSMNVSMCAPSAATEPGTASCFGVGCPCSNDDPTAGCANSTGSGALLAGGGTNSVSADDLVLNASQLPTGQQGLFYMGDGIISSQLYDGLQCALGANTFRFLSSIQSSGGTGTMSYTGFAADAPALIVSGSTWHFHCWHRDVPGTPCGSGANFSNLYSVTFAP